LVANCVTLWIGDALGPIERACLKSVIRTGHRLALYCFKEPAGVPDGVEVRDAGEVLTREQMADRVGGSVGLFSDWFRYELLRQSLGTWIDTDVYVLGQIDGDKAYLFGEQAPGTINGAVLRMPADSPLLPRLLQPFEESTTPPWLKWRFYIPSRLRELARGRADLARLPWGSIGPHALTELAKEHGVYGFAEPVESFYPVPWQQAEWVRDPKVSLDSIVTPGTVAIHLWNERIRSFKDRPAPEGSFLNRLQCEGAAD
jgi:hypothetical protein